MDTTVSAPPAVSPHAQLLEMVFAPVVTKSVYAIAELGIADHLKDGPRTADELARATGANPASLYRLLRTTSALGFFREDAEKRFALAPLGETILSDAPARGRSTVRAVAGDVFWRGLGEFLYSVKTGTNGIEKVFGKNFFEYLSEDPALGALFNDSMIGIHGGEPPAVAAAYDFSGIRKLVDVGGGTGNLLTTILAAHPAVHGVLFDAPAVAAAARMLVEQRGLAGRVEFDPGDFFERVTTGADAYILSHIIHDWDDARSIKILGNIRRAMAPGGRVLLVEMVIPEGNAFHPGKLLDMVMLACTPGGLERTAAEYQALLAKAGLRMTRVVPTESPVSVVEAVQA